MSLGLSELPRVSKEITTPKEQRTTSPYLTRFEHDRVIQLRSNQISTGTGLQIQVEVLEGELDPYPIAERELEKHLITDLRIRRELPDGTLEIIPVSELLLQDESPEYLGEDEEVLGPYEYMS